MIRPLIAINFKNHFMEYFDFFLVVKLYYILIIFLPHPSWAGLEPEVAFKSPNSWFPKKSQFKKKYQDGSIFGWLFVWGSGRWDSPGSPWPPSPASPLAGHGRPSWHPHKMDTNKYKKNPFWPFLSVLVSLLLSASVKRFSVSREQDFHRIGPLGRFVLVVAMSVFSCCCCLSVPFSCTRFWGIYCPHFPKSDSLGENCWKELNIFVGKWSKIAA